MSNLRKRYNMKQCKPYISRVLLPSSGVEARVPCLDAWPMIRDLLTDPRIGEEDYLWFNDDPTGGPPAEWLELAVGDISTGFYGGGVRPVYWVSQWRRMTQGGCSSQ